MTPPDDPALVRVLASDGTFAPTPEAERFLPLIEALTDADLETFYRDMVTVRAFDRQATNLQRQGQLVKLKVDAQTAAVIRSRTRAGSEPARHAPAH